MLIGHKREIQVPENKAAAVATTSGTLFAVSVVALAIVFGTHLQVGILGYSVVITVGFSSFVVFSVSFYRYNQKKRQNTITLTVPIAAFRKRTPLKPTVEPAAPPSESDNNSLNVSSPGESSEEESPLILRKKQDKEPPIEKPSGLPEADQSHHSEETDDEDLIFENLDAASDAMALLLDAMSSPTSDASVPGQMDSSILEKEPIKEENLTKQLPPLLKVDPSNPQEEPSQSSSDDEDAIDDAVLPQLPCPIEEMNASSPNDASVPDQSALVEEPLQDPTEEKPDNLIPADDNTQPLGEILHSPKPARTYKEDPIGPPEKKEKEEPIKGEDPIENLPTPLLVRPVIQPVASTAPIPPRPVVTETDYKEYMQNFYEQLSQTLDCAEESAVAFVSAFKKTERKGAKEEAKKIQESFATFRRLLGSYFTEPESEYKLFKLVFTMCSSIFTSDPQHLVESADIELTIENLYLLAKEKNGFMRPFLTYLQYNEQFKTHLEKIYQTNFTEKPFQQLQQFNDAYKELENDPSDVSLQIRCIQAWAGFIQSIAIEAKFSKNEIAAWNAHFFESEPFSPILLAFNNMHSSIDSSLRLNYIGALLPLIEDLEKNPPSSVGYEHEQSNIHYSNALYRLKKGKFSSNIIVKLNEVKGALSSLDDSAPEEFLNLWTGFIELIAREADLTKSQIDVLKEFYTLNPNFEFIAGLVNAMEGSILPQPLQLTSQNFPESKELCLFYKDYLSTVSSSELIPLLEEYQKAHANWIKNRWGEVEQLQYLMAWTNLMKLFARGSTYQGTEEDFIKKVSWMHDPLQKCFRVVHNVSYLKNNYFLRPFFKRLDMAESESLRRKIDEAAFSTATLQLLQKFKVACAAWEKKKGDLKLQTACIALWNQFLDSVAKEADFDERETFLWRAALQDLCWSVVDDAIKIQSFMPCFLNNRQTTFCSKGIEVSLNDASLSKFLRSLNLNNEMLSAFVNTLLQSLPQKAVASLLELIQSTPVTKEALKYVEGLRKAVIASRKNPDDGRLSGKIGEAWIVLLQQLVFNSNLYQDNSLNLQIIPSFLQAFSTLLSGEKFSQTVNIILAKIGSQYRPDGKLNEQYLEEKINAVVQNLLSMLPMLLKTSINQLVKKGATSPTIINNLLDWAVFPHVIKPEIEATISPILGSSRIPGSEELDHILNALKNILYVTIEPILKATFKEDRFRTHFQGILSTPYLRLKPQLNPAVSWSNLLAPCVGLLKKATETLAVGDLFAKIYQLRQEMQKQIHTLSMPSRVCEGRSITITCYKYENETKTKTQYAIFENNLTPYFSGLLDPLINEDKIKEEGIEEKQITIDLTVGEDLPVYTYVILQYLGGRDIRITSLDPVLLLQAASYFNVPRLMIMAQQQIIERLLQAGGSLTDYGKHLKREILSIITPSRHSEQGKMPKLIDIAFEAILDHLLKEKDEAFEEGVRQMSGIATNLPSLTSYFPAIEAYRKNAQLQASLASAGISQDSDDFSPLYANGWTFLAAFLQIYNGVIANQELEEALAGTHPPVKVREGVMLKFNGRQYLCQEESLPENLKKPQIISTQGAPALTDRVLQYLSGQLTEEAICDYKPEDIYKLMLAAKSFNVLRLQLLGQRLLIDHFLNNANSKFQINQIINHGWIYLANVLKSHAFKQII